MASVYNQLITLVIYYLLSIIHCKAQNLYSIDLFLDSCTKAAAIDFERGKKEARLSLSLRYTHTHTPPQPYIKTEMGPMPPDHLQRAPPISSYFTLCMLQRSRFSFCDAHKGKEKGKKRRSKE